MPQTLREKIAYVMADFAAAWSIGDIEALMSLMSADPVYRTSGGVDYVGHEEVRRGFQTMCSPQSGTDNEPRPMILLGERQCLCYWTIPLMTSSGVKQVEGVDVITFADDGKIEKKDAYRKVVVG